MREHEEKKVRMPRREFIAVGGTSIAAAALGAPNPLSATDKVQTIEQQEREIVALTFDVFGTVVDWRTSVIRVRGALERRVRPFDEPRADGRTPLDENRCAPPHGAR